MSNRVLTMCLVALLGLSGCITTNDNTPARSAVTGVSYRSSAPVKNAFVLRPETTITIDWLGADVGQKLMRSTTITILSVNGMDFMAKIDRANLYNYPSGTGASSTVVSGRQDEAGNLVFDKVFDSPMTINPNNKVGTWFTGNRRAAANNFRFSDTTTAAAAPTRRVQ